MVRHVARYASASADGDAIVPGSARSASGLSGSAMLIVKPSLIAGSCAGFVHTVSTSWRVRRFVTIGYVSAPAASW